MNNTSYPYKLNWSSSLIAILLFGSCTVFLASIALNNQSELIINHLIFLSAHAATNFYWFLSVLTASFVICILWIMTWNTGQKRGVILTHRSITAPTKGSSKQIITIPYHEITTVFVDEISGNRFLKIFSHDQKLIIPHCMLPKNDFDYLLVDLANRIKLAKKEAD